MSFDTMIYEAVEGMTANITLRASTLNYAFPFDVHLMCMDSSLASSEGGDYILFTDNVSFAAGQEHLSFEADVPDDQVAELSKFLKIEIVGYSSCLDGLVVDGGSTSAFVHIQDNDSECRCECGHRNVCF